MTGKKYKKGYFWTSDDIFDVHHSISTNAKLVYCYLCRRSDKAGISFPSQERIGRDCSIKSTKTVRNALKELMDAELIHDIPNKFRKSKTYCVSTKAADDIPDNYVNRPDSGGQNLPTNIVGDTATDRQKIPTKEYTVKENTHKGKLCDLNETELDCFAKEWMNTFNDNFKKQSTEPLNRVRENLKLILNYISRELPNEDYENLKKHTSGIIKWYLGADIELNITQGNEWVYKRERKISRLSQNFQTVWVDYWSVNQPVKDWEPPVDLLTRKDDVSDKKMREAFEKLPAYKKLRERKLMNGSGKDN